jgi:hypothetical protein
VRVRIHDEEGQALLLALAFLIFASLVIGATLEFAYSSASTTFQLREQRDTVYTADGATDAAIQAGRVDNTVGGYGDPRCQANLPNPPATATGTLFLTTTITNPVTNNATTASVICSYDPAAILQPNRTVIFTTFVSGVTSPVVQAKVFYNDANGNSKPGVVYWTYCGHSTAC